MPPSARKQLTAEAYTIAVIYVKPIEMGAITAMLDEFHQPIPLHMNDTNEYTLGRIGYHNIAIAGPAKGLQGKVAISSVVARIPLWFRNIRICLLVGIGGGIPHPDKQDIRLGDVIVGAPEYGPAVVQYDLGKQYTHQIKSFRVLNKPPEILLRVVDRVHDEYQRAEGEDFFTTHMQRFEQFPRIKMQYRRPKVVDRLFQADFEHDGSPCNKHNTYYEVKREQREPGEIRIHYGTILSGDMVMKSGKKRDILASEYPNAFCFEMEAAGIMDILPCLVIRGICDYSDSHKNKDWQEYAAATAACYAREVLLTMAERVGGDLEGIVETVKHIPEACAVSPSRSFTFPGKDTRSGSLWGGKFFHEPPLTPPTSSTSKAPVRPVWGGKFFK